ncbi:MAG: hypothetical protein ACYSSP_12135 [Planctomycetota bacterium]|jgi:hypothetical protein
MNEETGFGAVHRNDKGVVGMTGDYDSVPCYDIIGATWRGLLLDSRFRGNDRGAFLRKGVFLGPR